MSLELGLALESTFFLARVSSAFDAFTSGGEDKEEDDDGADADADAEDISFATTASPSWWRVITPPPLEPDEGGNGVAASMPAVVVALLLTAATAPLCKNPTTTVSVTTGEEVVGSAGVFATSAVMANRPVFKFATGHFVSDCQRSRSDSRRPTPSCCCRAGRAVVALQAGGG